jgi:hypothetical protein
MFRHREPPPRQPDQPDQPDRPERPEPSRRGRPEPQPPAPPATRGRLSYWQFVRQRLEHFEIPWDDDANHFDRLLHLLHCTWQYRLGTSHQGFWVEVYRNERPSPSLSFEYLLTLNGRTASDIVLIGDLPDLLYLLEHLTPIVQTSMESAEREGRRRPLVIARDTGPAGGAPSARGGARPDLGARATPPA